MPELTPQQNAMLEILDIAHTVGEIKGLLGDKRDRFTPLEQRLFPVFDQLFAEAGFPMPPIAELSAETPPVA